MVRPYLSWPWVWRMTSLPKTNADTACFARVPKAWPFSGQSIPLRRIRSAWLLCRTSMVSPRVRLLFGETKCRAVSYNVN